MAAGTIENVVLNQIREIIQAPEMVAKTWRAANRGEKKFTEREISEALKILEPVWGELFPGEQSRLVQLLVARVEIKTNGIEILLRGEGLDSLVWELRDTEEVA